MRIMQQKLTNENGGNRETTFGKSDLTQSKQRCCKNQFFDKEYYNGSSPAAKKEEKIENTTEVLWRPEGEKLLVFFFSLAELKTTHILLYLNVILKSYKIILRELVLTEVKNTDRSSLCSPCISTMFLNCIWQRMEKGTTHLRQSLPMSGSASALWHCGSAKKW